ncbi:hypothetical protein ABZ896_28605 [Streptomyces sp. NPDC047072]|uniref:hypothetical protein n=1 Tax=Streptomyces sp. NPDC047072 TaxID=3154809 RepID=UPI0034064B3E
MSSAARVPAVLALAVLAVGAPVPTALAADGWSLAPAGGGRPSFYVEGAPGTVVEDTVSVTNRGGKPVTVRLSGAVFARAAVTVPARTRADVPFTVRVPDGDRTAGITARDTDGRTRHVGLRLRPSTPELAALTVEHVTVRGDRITYDVVNRGTTALVPTLAVRADGLFGRVLDRAPRLLRTGVPPGGRLHLTEPWADRPALDVVDVRLTVTAAGGARDTARTEARFVPWNAVAGLAAVAAAGALLAVRRRRRRTPDGVPGSPGAQAELTGATT